MLFTSTFSLKRCINSVIKPLSLFSVVATFSVAAYSQEIEVCSTRYTQTFGNTTSTPSTPMLNAARLGPPLLGDGTEGFSTYPYGVDSGGTSIIRGAGYYYRVTTPRDHQGWNGWLNAPDHTGDPGGYFLIYDGHQAGTVAYYYDFNQLVAGAEYTASVWVANIFTNEAINGSYRAPNLTIQVRDLDTNTIIGSEETGNLPSSPYTNTVFPWQELSFTFTAGSNLQNVRMEVINNTNAPFGADFAIDDISIKGDCSIAPPKPVPDLSAIGFSSLVIAMFSLGGWVTRRKTLSKHKAQD